jgi:hypothetical protein
MPTHKQVEERATQLWPNNPALQEKWLAAVAYLMGRKKWVLYGGCISWKT